MERTRWAVALCVLWWGCGESGQTPAGPAQEALFQVQPGSAEWAELTSHAEMVAAVDIDRDQLAHLPTAELVELCMSYPLLGDALFYNTLSRGVEAVTSRFNGFQELFQRSDVAEVLLQRYGRMDPWAWSADWSPAERGQYAVGVAFFEILLARPSFLAQLSRSQLQELARLLVHNAAKKQRQAELYGVTGLQTSAFVAARLLDRAQFPPFLAALRRKPALAAFLRHGQVGDDPSVVGQTLAAARDFLEQVP